MRIFKNLQETYNELERELKHNGVVYQSATVQDKKVDYKTKELMGYSYLIKNPNDWPEVLSHQKLNVEWAKKEFKERLSSHFQNPGNAWKLRKEIWGEFIHGNKFAYTYNERIGNQTTKVIQILKKYPTSRQAIIQLYDKHLDLPRWGGKMRIPCSIFYQAIIDREKHALALIYVMRSCDFVTHYLYDVSLAVQLKDYLAKKLKCKSGNFIHFISSLHVFYQDNKEIF